MSAYVSIRQHTPAYASIRQPLYTPHLCRYPRTLARDVQALTQRLHDLEELEIARFGVLLCLCLCLALS